MICLIDWRRGNMDKISIQLPAISDYLPTIRMTASTVASNMGFDIEEVEDIKLAVSELCNNVVIHAQTTSNFIVDFIKEKEKITIVVEDFGIGFQENQLSSDGFGIMIAKSLMDSVTFDSILGKGTKVTMIKNVERANGKT